MREDERIRILNEKEKQQLKDLIEKIEGITERNEIDITGTVNRIKNRIEKEEIKEECKEKIKDLIDVVAADVAKNNIELEALKKVRDLLEKLKEKGLIIE